MHCIYTYSISPGLRRLTISQNLDLCGIAIHAGAPACAHTLSVTGATTYSTAGQTRDSVPGTYSAGCSSSSTSAVGYTRTLCNRPSRPSAPWTTDAVRPSVQGSGLSGKYPQRKFSAGTVAYRA